MQVKQKSPRFKICNILFFLKAALAICLGLGALSFNSYKVYDLFTKARLLQAQVSTPKVINPALCLAPVGLAKLEPPSQTLMLGFAIDWAIPSILPNKLQGLVGNMPAVINAFLNFDPTANPPFDVAMWDWHAQQTQLIGGIFALTLQPLTLAGITTEMYQQVAQQCYRVNTVYGTAMFMRWGHEMNGNWVQYGLQPTEYISVFQLLAAQVHNITNMTAMAWTPNNGINYPFGGVGLVNMPLAGTPDFLALDTNRDGAITNADDPYLPYYPGDEAVDWVGISQYWYPDASTGYNIFPPATYFFDSITSTGPTMELQNIARSGDPTREFYNVFVVEHDKPFLIPETSAPYFPNVTTGPATNAQITQDWWEQMLGPAVHGNFTRMKALIAFEDDKYSGGTPNLYQQFRVTEKPDVLSVFNSVLTKYRSQMSYATDFTIDCGGNWVSK